MKHITFTKNGTQTRIDTTMLQAIIPELKLDAKEADILFKNYANNVITSDEFINVYLLEVDDWHLIEFLKDEYDIEISNASGLERYGLPYVMNTELLYKICDYMEESYRERLHTELAPCDAHTFFYEYVTRYADDEFMDIMQHEFNLTI